jgi:hypothetical protein
MATTTTNNGWTIPQSTDLVTNGATAIATLGNGIDTSVGTGLKAWTAYTPTLTGWGVGNGTWDSYYVQLGKTVIWRVQFTVGSTTTFGNLSMTPPVAPRSTSTRATPAAVLLGAANGASVGIGYFTGATTFAISAQSASGSYVLASGLSSVIPATWGTGDRLSFVAVYEAA